MTPQSDSTTSDCIPHRTGPRPRRTSPVPRSRTHTANRGNLQVELQKKLRKAADAIRRLLTDLDAEREKNERLKDAYESTQRSSKWLEQKRSELEQQVQEAEEQKSAALEQMQAATERVQHAERELEASQEAYETLQQEQNDADQLLRETEEEAARIASHAHRLERERDDLKERIADLMEESQRLQENLCQQEEKFQQRLQEHLQNEEESATRCAEWESECKQLNDDLQDAYARCEGAEEDIAERNEQYESLRAERDNLTEALRRAATLGKTTGPEKASRKAELQAILLDATERRLAELSEDLERERAEHLIEYQTWQEERQDLHRRLDVDGFRSDRIEEEVEIEEEAPADLPEAKHVEISSQVEEIELEEEEGGPYRVLFRAPEDDEEEIETERPAQEGLFGSSLLGNLLNPLRPTRR